MVFDSLKVSSTILSVVCERNNLTVQIDWKTYGSQRVHFLVKTIRHCERPICDLLKVFSTFQIPQYHLSSWCISGLTLLIASFFLKLNFHFLESLQAIYTQLLRDGFLPLFVHYHI